MCAIKCGVLVVLFCAVFTLQYQSTNCLEKYSNALIRIKRYNVGGWHRPFNYKNDQWTNSGYNSWSNTRPNESNNSNRGPHGFVFHSNNPLGDRTNENNSPRSYQSQYIGRPKSGISESIYQLSQPSSHFMPSYHFNRNFTPPHHWGLPGFNLQKPKLPEVHQYLPERKYLSNTAFNSQIISNFNTQEVSRYRTILAFNRTHFLSQTHPSKIKPMIKIGVHSNDEPKQLHYSIPRANRTNLNSLKTNQILKARESHFVTGNEFMNHASFSPIKNSRKSNETNNAPYKVYNTEVLNKSKNSNTWIWSGKGDFKNKELTSNLEDSMTEAYKTNTPVTDDILNSPSEKLDVPMPDFTVPGRRISEIKCYEYLWHLKNRVDKTLRKARRDSLIRGGSSHNNNYTISAPHTTIGGRDTIPGEYPHMGAIGWKAKTGTWIFKCGSSLISNKFVLTAAHCSQAPPDPGIADPVPKIVRLGDKNIIDVIANDHAPYDVSIIRIIVHPKYTSPKQYFDIALMELEKEVTFSKYIQPACLWSNLDTIRLGKEATLTGWGVIESAGLTTSPELQAAVVDVLDTKMCDQLLRSSCNRNWCGFRDHQICAGKLAGGVDACQGDSGGPLQVKIPLPTQREGSMHFVIGIIAFGVRCARPQSPGIYTRVASFLDWIEKIVWPLR